MNGTRATHRRHDSDWKINCKIRVVGLYISWICSVKGRARERETEVGGGGARGEGVGGGLERNSGET